MIFHISMPALLLAVSIQQAGTLNAELLARNLPVPADATDLHARITNHAVLDDAQGFVIAYYELGPSAPVEELRVRAFDRGTRSWKVAKFAEPIGSVLSIHRGGAFLYVTGHSSPSAAPLLVLTRDLKAQRELDGWAMLVLPDGRVVFHRSMIHFAPTHAAAIALYDPVLDRETAIYPADSVRNERGIERIPGTDLHVDRAIDAVKAGSKPGTIEFAVVEQRMRLNRAQRADPASPEARFTMVCDLTAARFVCSRR